FSIKIIDLERKVNVNLINELNVAILQQALNVVGADPAVITTISDSCLDWIDLDENPHLSGTESGDYIAHPNPGFSPYVAKNGPQDDLSELLLIRGVTPEIYFGPSDPGPTRWGSPRPPPLGIVNNAQARGPVGLVDLF